MTNSTVSNTAYLLKTLWPQERVENMVYKNNAFLAMVPKSEDFDGENLYLATRYADSAGRSATFATAQANKAPHKGKRFLLTRGHDYALFGIDHEMILASKRNKAALINALDTEVESATHALTRSLAIALWQDGSGVRGQLGADPGTSQTFTLSNLNDVTNFEVGMSIVFAVTKTGALTAGGARTIDVIDRDAGTIHVTAALDAALGSSDYIIAEGDAQAAGAAILPVGVLGWCPSSAPAATTFFGVDRTPDATRLGGIRVDESALNPEEGLVTMLARAGREGADTSHIFRNPIDYKNIELALGSKVVTEYMEVGDVGFTAIRVNGPKGQVRIVSDQNLSQGRGFALDMSTWKFRSLGKAPMRIEADGLDILRDATSDSFEGRMAYYGQLGCDAPGYNVNELLP